MKFLKQSCLAVATSALLGFGVAANASTIDLFDDPFVFPGQTVSVTGTAGATGFSEYGSATSILGGYRDLVVTINSTQGGVNGTSTARVADGSFSFSNENAINGTARVQWDGNDNSASLNYTGLRVDGVGVDLINQVGCPFFGCDRFVAQVVSADLGFQYQIGVYTDAANYTLLTATSIEEVVFPGTEVIYLFEWFGFATGSYDILPGFTIGIQQAGAGADLTNVGALELVINTAGTFAVDLRIDSIEKTGVPEPGVLALFGAGLLAAGVARSRRKAKAVKA